MRDVPILTYHSLDESGSVISIAPGLFRRHIQTLHERGYEGITLRQLFAKGTGEADLPPHPVVLTFDDGFLNVMEHALPVLHEFGFAATIFVVTGYCGKNNDWPTQPSDVPRMRLLSWADLRGMTAAGFEIGAHTITHPRLTALSEVEAKREMIESKHCIEERLGQPVTSFAYPYGLAGPADRETAAKHFDAACSDVLGMARLDHDRHWLRRVDMYYFRSLSIFRIFDSQLGRAYLGLRAFGHTCRGALTSKKPSIEPSRD